MSNWIPLKMGDRIDALCELEVTGKDAFRFLEVSECAEGRFFSIWIKDDSSYGGRAYEISYRPELDSYAYDLEDPLP